MHTPGPWNLDGTPQAGDCDILASGQRIAMLDNNNPSDARLIAAAPDLLAFAQAVANYPGADAGLVIAARTAIAKALGE